MQQKNSRMAGRVDPLIKKFEWTLQAAAYFFHNPILRSDFTAIRDIIKNRICQMKSVCVNQFANLEPTLALIKPFRKKIFFFFSEF